MPSELKGAPLVDALNLEQKMATGSVCMLLCVSHRIFMFFFIFLHSEITTFVSKLSLLAAGDDNCMVIMIIIIIVIVIIIIIVNDKGSIIL